MCIRRSQLPALASSSRRHLNHLPASVVDNSQLVLERINNNATAGTPFYSPARTMPRALGVLSRGLLSFLRFELGQKVQSCSASTRMCGSPDAGIEALSLGISPHIRFNGCRVSLDVSATVMCAPTKRGSEDHRGAQTSTATAFWMLR